MSQRSTHLTPQVAPEDRLVNSLNALYAILPPELMPRSVADNSFLTRKVTFMEQVLKHLICLTNRANVLRRSSAPPLAFPSSVFKTHDGRDAQCREILARLLKIMGLPARTAEEDAYEGAYTRIKQLEEENAVAYQRFMGQAQDGSPQVRATHQRVRPPTIPAAPSREAPSTGKYLGPRDDPQAVLNFHKPFDVRLAPPNYGLGPSGAATELPSFRYVLKSEALGQMDRLAMEMHEFAVSQNLR
ncbi:hypothetical protein C8R47DRAFT_1143604 [Mycena vitilis]|nr:hypothetical protein C8R47DRAFT_1143604 [Mycena vitilis]